MSKLRVNSYSISIDGYGAGPGQDLENPMGIGAMGLHSWVLGTRTFQKIHGGFGDPRAGEAQGSTGPDDDFAARGFENIGAWILGRNMFGPQRGPWPDDGWKGWWGDNPPYHVPTFVLTHHARAPLTMEGGTTFYFVTDGIKSVLQKAKAAAKGKDVRIGGGVATIRQYLTAGQIDEIHLAMSPIFLGEGEHLFSGLNLNALGFTSIKTVGSEKATHVLMKKR